MCVHAAYIHMHHLYSFLNMQADHTTNTSVCAMPLTIKTDQIAELVYPLICFLCSHPSILSILSVFTYEIPGECSQVLFSTFHSTVYFLKLLSQAWKLSRLYLYCRVQCNYQPELPNFSRIQYSSIVRSMNRDEN